MDPLKTFVLFDELAALFDVPGLPPLIKNDTTLAGCVDTTTPGVKWKLVLNSADIVKDETEQGDVPQYELSQLADLHFVVEGEPGEARENVIKAGMLVLAGVLYPGGRPVQLSEGSVAISDCKPSHHEPQAPGTPPLESYDFGLAITLTAPTPVG